MRWKFLIALVCMGAVSGTTGLSAWLMQPAIDGIFAQQRRDLVLPIAMAICGVFVVKGLATFFVGIIMNDIARRSVARIQGELFRKLMDADLARLHKSTSGAMIAHLTNDVGLMQGMVSSGVTALGKDATSLVFLVGVMLILDPELFLIAGLAFPLAVLPIILIGRFTRRYTRRQQNAIAGLMSRLTQVFQSVRHVKAYNAEERETARAYDMIWNLARISQKQARVSASAHPLMETLAGLAIAGVIAYGGYQVIDGVRTPGTFMAYITAVILAYEPLKRLAGINVMLQNGLMGAERVFATLDNEPAINDKPGAIALGRVEGRIRFQNVHFAYGPDIPALRGVDFEVRPGERIAFVGPSGAGKSTALNLIPRFYDPDLGAVLIDGHDLRDVTMHSLRDNLALVSQEVVLFDDTIRENIRYARPNASEEDVLKAAKAAAAHDFIADMPEGYDTRVGEQGVRLSGGQRQRISIARAMLKDAPVLLLDEATSALDTQSERLVQEALRTLMKGRTTVVIAHRLSTVVDCDRIFVFNEGRIVETGAHGALIAENNLYARLWRMQTSDDPEAVLDEPRAVAGE